MLFFPLIIFVPILGSASLLLLFIPMIIWNSMIGGLFYWTGCFRYEEFGPLSKGFCGNGIFIVAYIITIFLISWLGNLKKDKV